MTDSSKRRQQKLVPGSFQLRVALGLIGLSALALGIQFLYLCARLTFLAQRVDAAEGNVVEALPGLMLELFVLSVLVLVPVLFIVAIMTTFRIAGPLYGLERYLRSVADGNAVGRFSTRKGDRIDGIRDALNDALDTVREGRDGGLRPPDRPASDESAKAA